MTLREVGRGWCFTWWCSVVALAAFSGGPAARGDDAEQQFRTRDMNQDRVLSGTEIKGVEKADADGDGEITHQEFIASMASKGPSREELFAEAEKVFGELDINKDQRLSGTELTSVAACDLDADGRADFREFFEGFERTRGAGWKTVECGDGNVTVALPGAPEPLALTGGRKFHAAIEIDKPAIRFEVRISERPGDLESNSEQFVAAVRAGLQEDSSMKILDEDDAPYEGHPGWVWLLEGSEGTFHAVRMVLVANRLYELEAMFLKKPGALEKQYGLRFLESLTVRRQVVPPAPDAPLRRGGTKLPGPSPVPPAPGVPRAPADAYPPPPG